MTKVEAQRKIRPAHKVVRRPGSGKQCATQSESSLAISTKVSQVFVETFEDGLAVFDNRHNLMFCNQPFRDLHKGLADVLHTGTPFENVLNIGLERGVWDTEGQPAETWKKSQSTFSNDGKIEACVKFADGRWILRRATRSADGHVVEICSELTKWKNREEELSVATKRAEQAELETKRALLAEEARNTEEALLSGLNHWLHSCKAMQELNDVVCAYLMRLIPHSSGVLYIYNNSRDVLTPECSWNLDIQPCDIQPDDCWGLRQGRPYHFGSDGWLFECDHAKVNPLAPSSTRYFCIPILAHGETVGLLHIVPKCENADNPSNYCERRFSIACKCAEQISLAIANVRLRQELKTQSIRDSLTNLFNRRHFIERANREIGRASHTHERGSIIVLDVDHFKKFNDNFGHDAGDIVLKSVAREIVDHFRAEDVVCRMGGEEFAVLLPNAPADVAVRQTMELLAKIGAMKVRYGSETLPSITISAGAATYPEAGDTLHSIMQMADNALYQAKALGRNRVVKLESRTGEPLQYCPDPLAVSNCTD